MPIPVPGPGLNPPPVPPAQNESYKDLRWLNALRNRVLASLTGLKVAPGQDVGGTSQQSPDGTTALTLNLNDTGVTAGAYGDSTHVGQFTVDSKGRLTEASSVAISYPPVQFPIYTGGRPVSPSDGICGIDPGLTPPRPIWAYSASGTGWIDATGAAV